jgi:hypothetical protein
MNKQTLVNWNDSGFVAVLSTMLSAGVLSYFLQPVIGSTLLCGFIVVTLGVVFGIGVKHALRAALNHVS